MHSIISLRSIYLCAITATLVACQTNSPVEIEEAIDEVSSIAEQNVAAVPRTANSQTAATIETPVPAIDDLWDRIRSGFQLQEFYFHPDVSDELQTYADNQAFFDLTIERAKPFLFPIVVELEKRGLPLEIALLPFVESAFNPSANSSEQAAGIWQFIGATAASFGLQQDWWYDARRDPQASTLAALDYLEELLAMFDQDWLLALAAYNAGEGNVNRAIRRSDTDDAESPFWELALPPETRAHVPRVLAMARLVNNIEAYGITLTSIENSEQLVKVEIGAQIDLAQVAQMAGIEYTTLREFNPGYLQWATHPEQPQHILLPHAQALLLESGLAELAPDQFLTWNHYQIQPGDSLAAIANRLGTKVEVLQRANNLRGTQIIAGKSLLIPRGPNAESAFPGSYLATSPAQSTSIPSNYRIRSGDSLWSIAKRFDLHSSDIALWNGIALDSVLRPGQVINLDPNSSAENPLNRKAGTTAAYVVRSGDSMTSIAARFDADLQVLLEQNNLGAADPIFPGQVIQITQ